MYRILIVDDEQLERDALRFILNRGIDSMIEIREAANGREAIAMAQSFAPDIIFLDIRMPGTNGMEAAWSIREFAPRTHIVFLTAYNQFEYAQEAIRIGVDDFIVKPASEKKVIDVAEELIGRLERSREEQTLRKNTELKLNKITDYLENEFLYSLSLQGISPEKFYDYLSIMDIRFHSGRACIVHLLYESYPLRVESDYQKKVLKKRCAYLFRETLKEDGITCLYNMDLTNIYFLFISDRESSVLNSGRINERIAAIEERLRRNLDIEMIAGLGDVFHHPEEVLSSFSGAKKELSRSGRELTSAVPAGDAVPEEYLPLDLEDELEQALINGNRESVERLIPELREWLGTSAGDLDFKKRILLEMATVLTHAAASQYGCCRVGTGEPLYSGGQGEPESEQDLFSEFTLYISHLLEEIIGVQKEADTPAVTRAVQYIDENYMKDITLEETAASCSLSSFYFSKLFKQKKNMTFIDYLTNRRIREAKRLLETTDLSIKEITFRIGYNDPNYFTRVFRKLADTSPSRYRSNKVKVPQYNPENS